MTTHLKILSQSDIKTFNLPPVFNGEERKRIFNHPKWADDFIENFRTPTNKVGFALQLGYFASAKRFFVSSKFHKQDVEFICRKLHILIEKIDLGKYIERTFERHQEIILQKFGFQKYNDKYKKVLIGEALSLCSNQMKPRFMFSSLVEFLIRKKIEVPTYHTISEAITNALKQFEKDLLTTIQNRLTNEETVLLDGLIELSPSDEMIDSKLKRCKITLLKKINQSTKPVVWNNYIHHAAFL